ncbi:5-dehydro-2-deoxygluconokinase [Halocella sp. SP3-1]|uniref:5-dehydro-2-deoxygluconokinase n=1 Tax=Halocella sp. SP3-1 TaxID=2382161 RepID=UPI0013DF29DA|nr:5-dehydro-2-deoxygluconokinase [Halocella sp. SP3-1]
MDVITIGRATVDLFANDYNVPLKEVNSFTKYLGGSPANIATAIAKLGIKTGIISKVGMDACGEYVINYLKSNNVDTSNIFFDKKARTAIALGEIFPPDNFKVLFYRENSADLKLAIEDIDENYIKKAKILIVSGTALSRSPSREACLLAMKYAEKNNLKVIIDLDYREETWPSKEVASVYLNLAMGKADIVVGTKKEVAIATGFCNNDYKEIMKRKKINIFIVKDGKNGATAFTIKDTIKVPAFKVKVLNTVGAGDGFLGGFVYGLLNQFTIKKSLIYGSAVGAMAVKKQSCSDSYPDLKSLHKFLKDNTVG